MRTVGSGSSLVDPQLELAARQVARAGDVAGVEGGLLAHVEHDEVVRPSPPSRCVQLGQRHERRLAPRPRPAAGRRSCRRSCWCAAPRSGGSARRGRARASSRRSRRARASAGADCRRSRRRWWSGRGPCSRGRDRPAAPGRASAACRTGCRRAASGSPVGRSVRPGAADQQGVAGEHPVLDHQAHRIARVAGRVQGPQPQLADQQHVAVVEAQVGVGRRAERGASPPARPAPGRAARRPRSGRRGCGCRSHSGCAGRRAPPAPGSGRSG